LFKAIAYFTQIQINIPNSALLLAMIGKIKEMR